MTLEILAIVLQGVTAVAILFAGWQLLYHSRAMHRDLEMAYVVRYWQVMDGRSPQFLLTRMPGNGDDVVVVKYLQLCEDELELRSLGRVTDATWQFWSIAMHQQLGVAVYKELLGKAPPEDFTSLRLLVERGPGHDPLEMGWLRRRLLGL